MVLDFVLIRIKTEIGSLIYKLNKNHSLIEVSDRSKIHNSVFLRETHLKGNVSIQEKTKIAGGVYISGNVNIGRFSSLNGPNLDIYGRINNIEIGNFTSIARNVSIQEFNHNPSLLTTYLVSKNIFKEVNPLELVSKGPITIGNDCWIGSHSLILSGVNVGNGAIVAANSVVLNNVPPYAIVGGSPAKVLKYRFDSKIIERLLMIKWWDWEESKILRNPSLFKETLDEDILDKLEKLN